MTVTYHGRPCKHGHTLRYASRQCVACTKATAAKRYADPVLGERLRAQRRERWRNMTGVEYNADLLRLRRVKALMRMKKRNEGRPVG